MGSGVCEKNTARPPDTRKCLAVIRLLSIRYNRIGVI